MRLTIVATSKQAGDDRCVEASKALLRLFRETGGRASGTRTAAGGNNKTQNRDDDDAASDMTITSDLTITGRKTAMRMQARFSRQSTLLQGAKNARTEVLREALGRENLKRCGYSTRNCSCEMQNTASPRLLTHALRRLLGVQRGDVLGFRGTRGVGCYIEVSCGEDCATNFLPGLRRFSKRNWRGLVERHLNGPISPILARGLRVQK